MKSKKKPIIVISVVLVLIAALFVVFVIDSRKRLDERINDKFNTFIKYMSNSDYEGMKMSLADPQGNELTDDQLKNFLVNTGLYRAYMSDSETMPTKTKIGLVGFSKTEKGNISFSFTALDGEIIENDLEYVHKGAHGYFIAKDNFTKPVEKEYAKFPVAPISDETEFVESEEDDDDDNFFSNLNICIFNKEEDGKIYIEVYKEAQNDVKKYLDSKYHKSIEKNNDEKDSDLDYRLKLKDDYTELDVYWMDKSDMNLNLLQMSNFWSYISYSSWLQALNGIEDWHLTINNYDYKTNEFIGKLKVR